MKSLKLATGAAIMVIAMTPTAFAGNIGGLRTERTGNIGGLRVENEQVVTASINGNIGGLRSDDSSLDISLEIRGNIAGLFSQLFSLTF